MSDSPLKVFTNNTAELKEALRLLHMLHPTSKWATGAELPEIPADIEEKLDDDNGEMWPACIIRFPTGEVNLMFSHSKEFDDVISVEKFGERIICVPLQPMLFLRNYVRTFNGDKKEAFERFVPEEHMDLVINTYETFEARSVKMNYRGEKILASVLPDYKSVKVMEALTKAAVALMDHGMKSFTKED